MKQRKGDEPCPLNAIARICAPRRNHLGVQGIITYNFDDLLEHCLEKMNIQTNVISCEDDISTPDRLSIFHVHGYLPYQMERCDLNTELIFSEEDYHRVYRDACCWSNLAQLNCLREHTCLFIGCSLTDPNLRRLLDVAGRTNERPRHFAFLPRNSAAGDGTVNEEALEIYKDIDSSLREKYYAAMGLNIIRVDDFKEIPALFAGAACVWGGKRRWVKAPCCLPVSFGPAAAFCQAELSAPMPGVRPGQRPGYGGAARGRRCRRRFGPFCAHKKADGAPFSL